jgi:hypothetical protein
VAQLEQKLRRKESELLAYVAQVQASFLRRDGSSSISH